MQSNEIIFVLVNLGNVYICKPCIFHHNCVEKNKMMKFILFIAEMTQISLS